MGGDGSDRAGVSSRWSMKKLEGEPPVAPERTAIGSIALKTRGASEEQVAKLALAREWSDFLVHEGDGSQDERLPALKRNATTAIKHDPGFAFGFFVLGRIATFEGLEGHGVRFYQRALALDPKLEAAQRHLDLLTGSTPPPKPRVPEEAPTLPAMTSLDAEEPITELNVLSVANAAKVMTAPLEPPVAPPPFPPAAPPPLPPMAPTLRGPAVAPPVPEPPGLALKPAALPSGPLALAERAPSTLPPDEVLSQPPSGRAGMRVALGFAIAGALAIAAALASRHRSSTAPEPSASGASVSAQAPSAVLAAPDKAPPPVATSEAASAQPQAQPRAVAEVDAAVAAPDASTPPAVLAPLVPGPNQGVVKTRYNSGHRLFIDGVVVGQTPAQVLVTCGTHVVKVGSGGQDQSIDVPCGGTVAVDP